MKYINSFLLLLLIQLSVFGQNELEYEFDKARAYLAQRQIDEALLSLNKLYRSDPNNGNFNFLMGAAFAEQPNKSAEAIFHLKKAIEFVSEDYSVGNFNEKNAPIHTLYYLTIAFVQQDQCEEAYYAHEHLKSFNSRIDPYFIEEGKKQLMKCPFVPKPNTKETWSKKVVAPEGYDPSFVKKEVFLDSAALAERGFFIKSQEYSTKAPLYGVQIGANINPSPISNYGKVKNVDVFIDTKGIIRYVIGHFSIKSQAESLLNSLIEQGYDDAFVVNVNDERKYKKELISYNNINIRAGIKGRVDFFVQLGAFEKSIPDSILNLYHTVDELKEQKYENHTLLLVGPFDNYDSSLEKKAELELYGVNSPYIVAFNNRKKVPLQEAINYTE